MSSASCRCCLKVGGVRLSLTCSVQVLPGGSDPPADVLGADVARGAAGRHGAISNGLLRDGAGSDQVDHLLLAANQRPVLVLLLW